MNSGSARSHCTTDEMSHVMMSTCAGPSADQSTRAAVTTAATSATSRTHTLKNHALAQLKMEPAFTQRAKRKQPAQTTPVAVPTMAPTTVCNMLGNARYTSSRTNDNCAPSVRLMVAESSCAATAVQNTWQRIGDEMPLRVGAAHKRANTRPVSV
eukprot:scaffold259898_cov27-Tisochrysis_lutea.AAC.2